MKSKLIPFSIIIIIVILTFALCGNTRHLEVPDKIIVYNKDFVKELDKSSPEFDRIVELTQKRFSNRLVASRDRVDNETIEMQKMDGLGIEFIYSDEQELSIKNHSLKYYKLYFQLTSEKDGKEQNSKVFSFQYGDKYEYRSGTRRPLKYSEELVKLVEGFMAK